MYDPQGNVHITRGMNIFPQMVGAADVDKIVNCWGFNTVLINYRENQHTLAQVLNAIDVYRARGLVVIVERNAAGANPADVVGDGETRTYQQLVIDLFRPIVQARGSDPGVWWQPWSEPLGRTSVIDYDTNDVPSWRQSAIDVLNTYNRDMHDMIRAEGSTAPYLYGLPVWGQDWLKPTNNLGYVYDRPITELVASLKYHDLLFSGLDNVLIGPHLYGFRDNGTQADMNAYIDEHVARGVPVEIGDILSHSGNQTGVFQPNFMRLARGAFESGRAAGGTAWHWRIGGEHKLTTDPTTGGGETINDCQNPTNLTEFGQIMWDLAHGVLLPDED